MQANFRWKLIVIRRIEAKVFGGAVLVALSLFSGVSTAVQAAQTVVIRRGSFTQSIDLADLKAFAETGT
ncbi:MAG: alpha/beta hydrolase, partial [Coleofasciculus sp. S288]|nr:alpha/beta hydrolase [Coleofasciculus sp. S288]